MTRLRFLILFEAGGSHWATSRHALGKSGACAAEEVGLERARSSRMDHGSSVRAKQNPSSRHKEKKGFGFLGETYDLNNVSPVSRSTSRRPPPKTERWITQCYALLFGRNDL